MTLWDGMGAYCDLMIVCYELWLYSLSSNHEKGGAHCELFMHSVKNKEGALKLATDHGDV